MCVIVAQPEGVEVQKDVLKRCYDNNSDGCGFAYVKEDKMAIHKGFTTFKSFWKTYKKAHKAYESPFLLHFRIATSGPKSRDNVHPFFSTNGSAFAHNGTVKSFGGKIKNYSDSRMIATLLHNLNVDVSSDDGYILISSILGNDSKGVFLFRDKSFLIINAKKGEIDKGIWFSNDSYRKEKKTTGWFGDSQKEVKTYSKCMQCDTYHRMSLNQDICDLCLKEVKGKECCVCEGQLVKDEEIKCGVCEACWSDLVDGNEVRLTNI